MCHETPARFLWILPAQRAGAAGRAAVKIQTGPPAAPQAEHQGQQDIQAQLGEPDAIFQRLVPTIQRGPLLSVRRLRHPGPGWAALLLALWILQLLSSSFPAQAFA